MASVADLADKILDTFTGVSGHTAETKVKSAMTISCNKLSSETKKTMMITLAFAPSFLPLLAGPDYSRAKLHCPLRRLTMPFENSKSAILMFLSFTIKDDEIGEIFKRDE